MPDTASIKASLNLSESSDASMVDKHLDQRNSQKGEQASKVSGNRWRDDWLTLMRRPRRQASSDDARLTTPQEAEASMNKWRDDWWVLMRRPRRRTSSD
jgi:hypothetical protein